MRSPAICLAFLLLAACGDKKPAPEAKKVERPSSTPAVTPKPPPRPVVTTAPHACDVLDEAIAKRYLGDDATQTRRAQPNPHLSQCQWRGKGGAVSAIVGDWSSMHTTNPKDVAVAGIGEEAYDTVGGFQVKKGEHGLNVVVMVQAPEMWGTTATKDTEKSKEAEHKIAPDLLSKL